MTAALDAQASRAAFGGEAPDLDDTTGQVVAAWNLLGGEIDWQGLPVVCDLLAVDDPEALIRGLVMIRDHFREQRHAETLH